MKCLKPVILNTNMLLGRAKTDPTLLKGLHKKNNESIAVNCGTCYICRRRTAKEHALMISKEIKNGPEDERHFITLTYRNANLPYRGGHFCGDRLEKDKKTFIKKMRNNCRYYDKNGKRKQKKVMYYCGFELSPSGRPHLHLIICGLKLDLHYHKTKKGNDLFVSKKLSSMGKWGTHEIGQLNQKTASYVCGYILKKCDKNYNYKLQKGQPNSRTVYKGASPGGGLKGALEHIDTIKNNPKYHTKYGIRKIKEKIIKEHGIKAGLKYLKFHIIPDKRNFGEKGTYYSKGVLAGKNDSQIKRIDKID